MSVAYVLKVFPRLSQTFILGELLAHQRANAAVEIFSLRRPRDEPRHHALKLLAGAPQYLDLAPGRPVPPEAVGGAARRLAALAKVRGVHHLHAHFGNVAAEVARRAARAAGIGYSFTAHARDIFHDSVCSVDLRRKLDEAEFVVTVSDFNRRYLTTTFGEVAAKVVRVYNGIDLTRYVLPETPRAPQLLLAVGRLVPKKGFADLVDACSLLRDRGARFRCRVIGDGPLREELDRRVAEADLGDVVQLVGALPAEDVAAEMRRAAVLVAPCVEMDDGDRDGLPTVLPEAMALGLPCVSTEVTGIPEIVRDGETGLLVPPALPGAVADACERLLRDESLRTHLATGGRRLVETQFDIRANTRRLRELFDQAVERRRVAS